MEKGDRIYEKKDYLLRSAQAEFLKYGYEKASLRSICRNANVTTGALYFFFKNKADLYDCVVHETAEEIQALVDEKLGSKLSENRGRYCKTTGIDENLIQYLIDHKEYIELLCNKSAGSNYEGFQEMIEKRVADAICRYVKQTRKIDLDPLIYELIAKMRIACYSDILQKDLPFEEACNITNALYFWSEDGMNGMIRRLG